MPPASSTYEENHQMTWVHGLSAAQRAKLNAALAHGEEHLQHADGDRDYAGFLLVADEICRRKVGLSIYDLADFCWRDAYDNGMAPGGALRDALTAEGV
jgi:hypothetical protein